MKKLFHHPLTVKALAALLAFYGYIIFRTSRVQVLTPVPSALASGPVVLASWHQQVSLLVIMARPNPSKLLALIANSRAGNVIRAVAKWYDIDAVEGSSRRGGVAGARMLIRAARDGHTLYITPDGSRGPARVAKDGATEIAKMMRLPLIPCAVWPVRGKTLKTWDRFRLPFPFTTIRVAYGEPLETMTPQELTDALNRLTEQVQGTAASE